jgi:hypothetical protein
VNIEWDSLALAPKINVKIGYSVRYKDESETIIDPLQASSASTRRTTREHPPARTRLDR